MSASLVPLRVSLPLPPTFTVTGTLPRTHYLRLTILNDDDRLHSDTGLQPRTNQIIIHVDHYPMRSSLTTCFSESGAQTLL